MKSNVSIIIPVHEFNDTVSKLLSKALASTPADVAKFVITNSEDIAKSCRGITEDSPMTLVAYDEGWASDFSSLVNEGVKLIYAMNENGYFAILELDDEFNPNWFTNVDKYISYMPECSVFLPLTELLEYETNKFIGYGNEAPWASSFSEEIGCIDHDCLQEYFDFYLTGGVYRTSDWIECGGLKPSIKLTFWYEYLLRATNMGQKVYVIPKLGYKHYLNRPQSLLDIYTHTVDEKESKWWYDLSKEEFIHKEDRNKTYDPNEIYAEKDGEDY